MIKKIALFAAGSILIAASIAFTLIVSDPPKDLSETDAEGGLEFASVIARGISEVPDPKGFQMADGWQMPVRRYGQKDTSKPLLIFIHGSGWLGIQFNRLASRLSDQAYVVVPDLRGHGESPERRGDVDYIGQMEDDIAALIEAERLPGQAVILAGHSSGGGLVTRFAGGEHGSKIDKAILLAPFLKYNAPTTRENSGGWAHALTGRIIGLSMLNTVGITALNHLTIIQFNMPEVVRSGEYGHLATLAYSYRLNEGYAPRTEYLEDVADLPEFSLIVGSDDEAFYANKYEEVMSAVTGKGSYHILPGEKHLSIVDAPETEALIRDAL